jgi:hypothetical protein
VIQHEPPIWTWPVVLTLVFTTVTGVAAVVALLYAHIAYRGARRSNSIAADARQLAEEANEIATRAESREIERHDVYWDGCWETPGTYLLVKRGGDESSSNTPVPADRCDP